jgi:membrane-associated protein
MEFTQHFLDNLMQLDEHLNSITSEYGLLTYFILFAIIFCETGLVVTPFLPGDSLLFATGALAARGMLDLPTLIIILCVASIAGNTVNYQIGCFLRNKVANRENIIFIKQEYIDRAHLFFKKNGGKTLLIARFVPVIRCVAPFVAGVGAMQYSKFIYYNVVGGIAWVSSLLLGGYFFGHLAVVEDNFSFFILAIALISLVPGFITLFRKNIIKV